MKQFFRDLAADFRNFNRQNADPEAVYAARFFSCYRGVPVVKTRLRASFSFGVIGLSRFQQTRETLDHEFGHRMQLKRLGLRRFIARVAVPSVIINLLDRKGKLPYDYYGAPWEAEADRLGGVARNSAPWPEGVYRRNRDLLRWFRQAPREM